MQQIFLSLNFHAQEQIVDRMGNIFPEVMRQWPIAMQHVRSFLYPSDYCCYYGCLFVCFVSLHDAVYGVSLPDVQATQPPGPAP